MNRCKIFILLFSLLISSNSYSSSTILDQLTLLKGKLEKLLLVLQEETGRGIENKDLQTNMRTLLEAIDQSTRASEIYRLILKSLRELPILPERDEPLLFTPEEKDQEKELMRHHAAIMRKIMVEKDISQEDGDRAKEWYIEQLKNGFSKANKNLQKGEEKAPPVPEREPIEDRPLPPLPGQAEPEGIIPPPPPLPPEPEKKEPVEKPAKEETKPKIQPEEKEKSLEAILKEQVESRRGAIEGEDEEEEEDQNDENWESDPWDR